MKYVPTFGPLVATVLVVLLAAGCGLATSNEERLARAADAMAEGNYRAAMVDLKNALAASPDDAGARLMLAEVSLGLGDIPGAETELARAANLGAPEAQVLPLHLRILLAKSEFTEVLAALGSETAGLGGEDQWSFRGKALLGLGNGVAAAETYREWLSADPGSPDARVGLGNALAAQGETGSAIELFDDVLVGTPRDVAAWHGLAVVSFSAGDFARSEEAFQQAAAAIKPQTDTLRTISILTGLVEVQIVLGKLDDAGRNLEKLTGLAPNAPATLFLAASLARSAKDYALASRHLQTLLNVSPDNGQAQVFLASMQMMQGHFAQAENLLQRYVARRPDDLRARKLLAQVQLRQSHPRGAIEALAPLLESGVDDADLYNLLAQAEFLQGESDAAIQRLQASVRLAPDDPEAKLNLAAAYLGAGDAARAQSVLEQVPQGAGLDHRRERLMMLLHVIRNDIDAADRVADQLMARTRGASDAATIVAEHYFNTGRVERARAILQDVVAADAGALDAHNALAHIEMADGNMARAEKLYAAVIEQDENNLGALTGLARVAETVGDENEARRLLLRAAEAHRTAVVPRAWLARAYLEVEDIGSAERMANELLAIGVHNGPVAEIVGTVLAAAGRPEEALAQFERAVSLVPDSPRMQLGLARAYVAMDRPDDARQALRESLELSPGWPPALSLLALVELRQGRLDDARQTVAEYRRLHPGDTAAMALEGEVLLRQQQFDLAAQAYRRAADAGAGRLAVIREFQARVEGDEAGAEATLARWLDDSPDDTLTRSYLAQHYQNNGQSDDAVREYRRVLELQPENGDVLNNLAWEYQQQGELDTAVLLAEKAWSVNRDSGSYADTLGWIYRDLGRREESAKMLAEAARLAPGNGEILYHYAVVLRESAESERARAILEKLKDENARFPSRDAADRLLDQLSP